MTTAKIADGAVNNAKIQDNAVTKFPNYATYVTRNSFAYIGLTDMAMERYNSKDGWIWNNGTVATDVDPTGWAAGYPQNGHTNDCANSKWFYCVVHAFC